jgi:radical SAM protein with 4Fe4S-binding SPASM domain
MLDRSDAPNGDGSVDDALRPYAASDLIVRQVSREGRRAVFAIDPWTQRWAILEAGAERVLELADGRRTLDQLAGDVSAGASGPPLADRVVVAELARTLMQRGLVFASGAEHARHGMPVYNASEVKGIHLEITNACNLRCRHCYVSSGTRLPNELTDDELRAVVDQLEPFEGRTVVISGGEPAVRRGCMELVEYCAIERGHHIDLYTNGYKFPRKFAERLVDLQGRAPGTIRLQVSLEGARPATNDLIRGEQAFRRTLETLAMFRELGINRQTTVFICITKLNIDELDAMIALAERYDVARLHFSQWQRQGNADDVPWATISPDTAEWTAAGARVLQYDSDRLDITGNFFGDLKNTPSGRFTLDAELFPKHLYFYNSFPRISPDGLIFADQFWTDPEWALGNVRDVSLAEAFASPRFHAQMDAMRARVERVADCRACPWRALCECGSPGHTYAEYRHLWAKDLFCDARIDWFERFVDAQVDRALDAA